ncbi:hypothetical protein BLNAU_23582 [Blattamonas nauphoetae]|uniref:Uncharacterized protein n=1 Tax=Blattamonas nauphoetae TaxID=2049346 RepID=A0ABQ9WPT5_9EUKA|nr:hypothetical protein BLNAU_23580 [Blattamonas nauphoetae]KAK2941509.1 hypothetical protein BLNAU_23582 [Blattamonas nauphoetae]
MVSFAGTIGIRSRQSHSIIATLSFSFTPTPLTTRCGPCWCLFVQSTRNARLDRPPPSLSLTRGRFVHHSLLSSFVTPDSTPNWTGTEGWTPKVDERAKSRVEGRKQEEKRSHDDVRKEQDAVDE